MLLCAAKRDPQGQGAAITYARRFAYMSVLGLVADKDDDGNAATRARTAAPSKSEADLARDRLAALVKKHKLNGKEIGQRFADDYGMLIYDADAVVIDTFTKIIAGEIAAVTK
jgi:hypothetical protein